MPVEASVADSAPIPTRSKPDLSQPRPTKLVSQSAAKPVASIAGTKSRSSTILPSNSFRESGSAAPANRDNHVAQGANLSKTSRTQITLVSRKSRHPAKSRQSHGDAKDQCTTVLEFASYLQTQYRDTETKDKRQKPIFRDLIVYYVARDPGRKISHSTKRRMEIVCCPRLSISTTDSCGLCFSSLDSRPRLWALLTPRSRISFRTWPRNLCSRC